MKRPLVFFLLFFMVCLPGGAEEITINMSLVNAGGFPSITFNATIVYKGKPVKNLTWKNFELMEDKHRITEFSIEIKRDPIGVGKDIDSDILKKLAKDTGGSFFKTLDPAKIANIYRHLSILLNYQYYFRYKTPNLARDGKWRIVKLREKKSRKGDTGRYRVGEQTPTAGQPGQSGTSEPSGQTGPLGPQGPIGPDWDDENQDDQDGDFLDDEDLPDFDNLFEDDEEDQDDDW